MGRVVFAMGMSLDGYVEDARGSFDFTAPDDEVHRIANEQARDAAVFDLIDEFRTWVNPVAVGGGKPYFPAGGEQLRLRLLEQRAFASGALYLRYERVR